MLTSGNYNLLHKDLREHEIIEYVILSINYKWNKVLPKEREYTLRSYLDTKTWLELELGNLIGDFEDEYTQFLMK
jgi:hypothetical protein